MQRADYHSPKDLSPSPPGRRSSSSRYSLGSRNSSQQRSSVYSIDMDDRLPVRSRTNSTARLDSTNATPPSHDTTQPAVSTLETANKLDAGLIAQITAEVTQNLINKFKTDGIPTDTSSSGSSSPSLQPQSVSMRASGRRASPSSPYLQAQYSPTSPTGQYQPSSHGFRSSSPEPAYPEASSYASANNVTSTRDRHGSASSPSRNEHWERPRPTRIETAIHEATTLEKIWCPLFDNGRPTARLGQFLRGIAIHLIEDHEPKGSLVVTPGKMADFFTAVKQPDETYPFQDIFGGKCTNVSISRIYRGLGCQHHLTQFNDSDEPTIPGLTPLGFEVWMTSLIFAHPDKEFERLAKAVLNMPISNADSRSERFPKELPRRLFPRDADRNMQQKLYTVMSADRNIQLGRSSNPIPPPPPPIERERQPYTARQGTGKMYNENENGGGTRASRSNSTASAPSAYATRAMDVPSQTPQRQHHSSVSSGSRHTFQNSPPSSSPFIRSEGANVNEIPSSYYTSNIPSIASFEEDSRAYADHRLEDPAGGGGQWNSMPSSTGRDNAGNSFEEIYGRERNPRHARDQSTGRGEYNDRNRHQQ